MTRCEMFRKEGNRYSRSPFYTCNNPSSVFVSLCSELTDKYLNHSKTIERITRQRCPYCDSFDEVTVIHKMPDGQKLKSVYTVPHM